MRFNDLMQTVLASGPRSGPGAITLWRQCVDLLAQYDRDSQGGGHAMRAVDRDALLDRLESLRLHLSEEQRVASVVELGGRLRSPALAEFFARDRAAVCVAAMVRARLSDDEWALLIPRLTPTARGVLRARRDLGASARAVLERFGRHDLVLSDSAAAPVADVPAFARAADAPPVPAPDVTDERSQISELVSRIENYTATRRPPPPLAAAPEHDGDDDADTDVGVPPVVDAPSPGAPVRQFSFETDAAGAFMWVGDAAPATLIGLSIADPALPGTTGADGNIAGAFARRSSFQHGRYWISDGPYAGEWRLSAIPFFDQRSGRFQGYRGQARRPHIHEVPYAVARRDSGAGETFSLDSMRQLVHELRTPLNAILGFAEIIEQQLFGPAGVHYREMAGHILSDARRLLVAFDDLDMAARASAAVAERADERRAVPIGPEVLIERARVAFEQATQASGETRAAINIATAADLPAVLLDETQADRMLQHLLRTLVSVSDTDEPLNGAAWFQPDGEGGRVLIGFDRPARLRPLDEAQLLDPGYGADGDWPDAPLLGLGFSLRLVRSLAMAQGGALIVTPERIMLALPVARARADDEAAGN